MTTTEGLDAQRERAAVNQSLFREVNERIEELLPSASFMDFLCECASTECTDVVPLTVEEYNAIRADGNRFFVVAGHEIPQVEKTVEITDRYLVVSKLGAGKRIAEKLDPRHREGHLNGATARPL
jgi:hypothetical protein